MKILARS